MQNVRLLAGMAPTCYIEQLIYDCRLMNLALADGRDAALLYHKWMVNSDAALDPQAYVLTPESCIAIAQAIVAAPDYYQAGKAAALTAIKLLREGLAGGRVKIVQRELPWLDTMQDAVEGLPAKENDFINPMMPLVDTAKFMAKDYEL